jgi:hypothetical protein
MTKATTSETNLPSMRSVVPGHVSRKRGDEQVRRTEPQEWQPSEAPRERPTTYPGAWPENSILLAGATHFRLQLRRGRRLGQARILDCEHLPGEELTTEPELPLSHAMICYNVARVDDRTPVLAVGSNAAPAQLRHKYADSGVSAVMPLVKAKVEGLAAGVAAEVAGNGYVPATPIFGGDLVDELFVQWLDAHQLALLDETEPGYERLLLPAGDPAEGGVRITLPSGEVLGACYAYLSTRGSLADPSIPRRRAAAGPAPPAEGTDLLRLPREGPRLTGRTIGHDRQTELVTALLDGSPRLRHLMGNSTEWFVRIRKPGVVDEVRQIFQEEGWARQQDVASRSVHEPGNAPPQVYGRILPAQPPQPGTWRVVPSADDIKREGQTVVRVTTDTSQTLGNPRHVTLRTAAAVPGSDIERLEAIARVLVDDDTGTAFTPPGHTVPDHVIELDEVLRLALGVEVGEDVTLAGIRVHHRRWLNHLIGRPFYVTCRVQIADPATAEREVCLLDPLTLDLLGIESGAEVVVEGRADDQGEARQIRLKALAVTDSVRQRREAITGGDFGSRFPSVRDALGVAHEIPWIYIDMTGRALLGISGQPLATVRVRPSRSFQLRQELREMLVVLGLAFIGVIELVTETWARIGLLIAMVALVVTTISVRMRGRLMRRIVRPHRQRRRRR